jgi:hypothetical protein
MRMDDILLTIACGSHKRLGAASPFQHVESDLLLEIGRHIPVFVPDDAQTLKEAVQSGLRGQRIILRKGEHVVGASASRNEDDDVSVGATILKILHPVHIYGEEGVLLRGMLHMGPKSYGGSINQVTIHDSGAEACIKAEGGEWTLHRCFLLRQ